MAGGFTNLGKRMVLSVGGDAQRLPAVHTCTFQLDLPEYTSQVCDRLRVGLRMYVTIHTRKLVQQQ